MARSATGISLAIALCLTLISPAFAEIYKCNVGGNVTYQNTPCPAGKTQRRITLESPATYGQVQGKTTAPVTGGFKCDGRRYCTQMTSCAEADFFLSHCPGVEMDGDRDGIPCEQQWCKR